MCIWLLTAVASGVAAIGLTMGLAVAPAAERPLHEGRRQEASTQSRIAFEYLVRDFVKRDSAFIGTLRASDLSAAGVISASLTNGLFSPAWTATVAAGGVITFCAPVPDRDRPALLKGGYGLETLTCAN